MAILKYYGLDVTRLVTGYSSMFLKTRFSLTMHTGARGHGAIQR